MPVSVVPMAFARSLEQLQGRAGWQHQPGSMFLAWPWDMLAHVQHHGGKGEQGLAAAQRVSSVAPAFPRGNVLCFLSESGAMQLLGCRYRIRTGASRHPAGWLASSFPWEHGVGKGSPSGGGGQFVSPAPF